MVRTLVKVYWEFGAIYLPSFYVFTTTFTQTFTQIDDIRCVRFKIVTGVDGKRQMSFHFIPSVLVLFETCLLDKLLRKLSKMSSGDILYTHFTNTLNVLGRKSLRKRKNEKQKIK